MSAVGSSIEAVRAGTRAAEVSELFARRVRATR